MGPAVIEKMSSSTSDLVKNPKSSKKQKSELPEVFKLFKILMHEKAEELDKNVIWLHADDLKELFGSSDSSGRYVRIADHAYKVGIKNIIPGSICINNVQKTAMKPVLNYSNKHCESVVLSPINLNRHMRLKTIILRVEFKDPGTNLTFYEFNKLQILCAKKIVGKVVNFFQPFKLKSECNIVATVQNFDFKNAKTAQLPFGLVTSDTNLSFENASKSKITLLNLYKENNNLDFCDFVISPINRSKLQVEIENTVHFLNDNESFVLSLDTIKEIIFREFYSRPLYEGFKGEFKFEDQLYEIAVAETRGAKLNTSVKTGLYLNTHTVIDLSSRTEDLIIVNNGSRLFAKLCSFKIKGIWNTNKNSSMKRLPSWVNQEELDLEISKQKQFSVGQNFKVKLSNGTYLVGLECAEDFSNKKFCLADQESIKTLWSLDPAVKISYTASPFLRLKFVANDSTKNISNLSFVVSELQEYRRCLSGNEDTPEEILEVDLIEAVKKEITYPIVENQPIEITIKDTTFVLRPKNIVYENNELPQEMDVLSLLTETTKFSFAPNRDSLVTIIPKPGTLNLENLKEACKEIGLVGIQNQLDKLICNVMVHEDSELRKKIEPLGQKQVKGIILYGPPGTGKTTLARHISKFLGCDEKRVTLLSAPEILEKFVGESEKKIRELFENAKNYQVKYGAKSPRFTIIFDEFDAIASKRTDLSSEWHNSTIDQLLSMVDGFLKLDNVIVMGLTNNFKIIDPAIKRPGRFEFHLEMGLPLEAERLEIFELYTEEIRLKNLLDKKVNLKSLAAQTNNYSGADIKGLVRLAASYPVARIINFRKLGDYEMMEVTREELHQLQLKKIMELSDDEINKLDEAKGIELTKLEIIDFKREKLKSFTVEQIRELKEEKENKLLVVTKDDFQKALIEFDKTKEKGLPGIPFGMYG